MHAAFILCCLVPGDPSNPPLSDLKRFPPPCVVQSELALNQNLQDYLNARLEVAWHQRPSLGDHLRFAECLWECWDALRDAQCASYPEEFRRHRLADLRRRIGAGPYYLGRMPPGVPYWTFPEID
jgi:hypothetical protein